MTPQKPTPTDSAVPRAPGQLTRPVLAFVGTAVVTVLTLPLHLFLTFMFSVASQSYDTSGSGGPFKSCDSETYCSDPNYPWMLGTAGLMFLLWLVAAQVGQLVWDRTPRRARVLSLTLFSAALTALGCGIAYYLLTHATHAIF